MKLIRMTRLLAALVIAGVVPAHANGVNSSISSGDTKTGTVTGSGHDDYTFRVAQGTTFVVSLGETGVHDSNFLPQLEVRAPGQAMGTWEGRPYYTRKQITNAAAGDWKIIVSRTDSDQSSGGTYALKLVAVAGDGATAMSQGQEKTGTNTRGGLDAYSFSGTAGQTKRLTLARTGGEGFAPEVYVFGPNGEDIGSVYCAEGCSMDVATGNGTYTAMVWKNDDHDVTGSYSLSVGNAN